MTELEKVRKVFDEIQAIYCVVRDNEDCGDCDGVPIPTPEFVLSISQAHLFFDKDEKYIGVLDDEMGNFRPRKTKEYLMKAKKAIEERGKK